MPSRETKQIALQEAIRHMVGCCGKSFSAVSREIGHVNQYLSVMLNNRTTPRLDLMAKIANACGYRLVLVGHGEGLDVVPVTGEDGSVVGVRHVWAVKDGDGGELVLVPSDGSKAPAGLSGVAGGGVEAVSREQLIDALIAQLETMKEC